MLVVLGLLTTTGEPAGTSLFGWDMSTTPAPWLRTAPPSTRTLKGVFHVSRAMPWCMRVIVTSMTSSARIWGVRLGPLSHRRRAPARAGG